MPTFKLRQQFNTDMLLVDTSVNQKNSLFAYA